MKHLSHGYGVWITVGLCIEDNCIVSLVFWDCGNGIVFFLNCQRPKCFKVWRPNLDLMRRSYNKIATGI